ncbi:MAG: hypothetical protein A2Y57_01310 [Candidatus Woykebacteria bacterium RBG_13_40_7b]|uniref:Uncharacterized protein n=1 Tax=Candidatus Woykebacteria bacterium RBG_13_40_7b TaxID=1802594 RepID=A0A1G1WA26_9BACT|nr:MAG: hypothetical protein A2Y57_01310 [Candidatus Woykebacteria bacterium RBG_13_40_7b]
MQLIIWLLVIEVILGIVAALNKGDFNLNHLGNYVRELVVGYVFGFAVVEMVGQVAQDFVGVWLVPVTFVILVLTLIGGILGNLDKLGVKMPSWVKKE